MTSQNTGTSQPPISFGEEGITSIPLQNDQMNYVQDARQAIAHCRNALVNIDYGKDLRIRHILHYAISTVADDVIRDNLARAFDDAWDYLNLLTFDSEGKTMTMNDRIELRGILAARVLGEITSYLDEFVGLSRKNVIVPLVATPPPSVEAAVDEILKEEGGQCNTNEVDDEDMEE